MNSLSVNCRSVIWDSVMCRDTGTCELLQMKTSYHVMIGVLQIHMSCGELPAATESAVFVFYGNRQFLIYI